MLKPDARIPKPRLTPPRPQPSTPAERVELGRSMSRGLFPMSTSRQRGWRSTFIGI